MPWRRFPIAAAAIPSRAPRPLPPPTRPESRRHSHRRRAQRRGGSFDIWARAHARWHCLVVGADVRARHLTQMPMREREPGRRCVGKWRSVRRCVSVGSVLGALERPGASSSIISEASAQRCWSGAARSLALDRKNDVTRMTLDGAVRAPSIARASSCRPMRALATRLVYERARRPSERTRASERRAMLSTRATAAPRLSERRSSASSAGLYTPAAF